MMTKNFTLLLLMFFALNQLNAQEWVVYDGSVSPDSVFTSKPSDGTILTTAILDDPMLEGNKIFKYKVEEGLHRWQADLELPQNGVTLVSRVRADLDPDDFYLVNFAIRNGAVRPDIRVESGRINPDKVVVNANHDVDMTKWHVIRIALKSDNSLKVFMDENPVPVMVDTGDNASSNLYIQWGDGSSSSDYGGLVDWIVYDTTGAYMPGEGEAIPDSLSLNYAASVILVTDDDNDDEQYEWLKNQGFDVMKFYPGRLGSAGQDTVDMLNAADLVIIGRSPSSSDFQDSIDRVTWNGLTVPVMLNAQYDARSSRINWFNSTRAYHANEGPPVAYGVVSDPADPIFAGISLMGDSVEWCYPAHDFLQVDSTTNGTILVSYNGNNPLVVRFETGVEFYEGSVDMPAAPRTYFGFGNDKLGINYFPLSKAAKTAYLAEINRMTGQESTMPVFGAADNRIILVTDDENDDVQYEFLDRQGFNISKFYPGRLGSAGQDTVDMLNAADLVIIGRSPSSSDFQDSIDRVTWNGLTVPVLLNAQYDARSSRINWFNSTRAYHANEGPPVAYGVVSNPADPIFADVTLMVGDSLGWCYPAHDFIQVDSTSNGEILVAYAGNNPLVVRFETGVEFYEGSVDMPAAPRTYFGFGNDKLGINYFPLTRDAKKVYLAEVSRMVGVEVPQIVYGAADFNITMVSDDDNDDPQVNFLRKNGIRVTEFYPGRLGSAGQDTIDMLNAADLVIIGRSPSSSDFQDSLDRVAWNNLTAPLILNAQYDARSSRINWYNSTRAYHANEEPDVAFGVTSMPEDVVFSNVTLDGDSLAWCMVPHDFIQVDSVSNGTDVAVYAGNNPLLTRFEAGVEFYPGSVDMPAAPRSYFGFGNDKLDFANYFPLTPEAQQVYHNEISRMLGAELSIVKTVDANAYLDSLQYDVEAAVLTPDFDPDSMMYDLQLPEGSTVVTLTAMAVSEFSTVVGDSAIDVSLGDTITTVIKVVAENGNTMFYDVTVYPFVEDGPIGVEQTAVVSSLKLYPNPTTDQLNIVAEGEISHVTVYNAIGKVVLDRSYGKIERVQLNVSSLDTGIYLIKVEYDDQSSMTKFLKK